MCLAVPTKIKSISADNLAVVELGGVEREISLVMTPEAEVGSYVLVHTGYAINIMSGRGAGLIGRFRRARRDPGRDGGQRSVSNTQNSS